MMVASFGYCVSDVAADGLTVQLAKKEEIEAELQQLRRRNSASHAAGGNDAAEEAEIISILSL